MTETVPLEIAASIVGNERFLTRNNNYFVTLSRKSHVKEGVLREGIRIWRENSSLPPRRGTFVLRVPPGVKKCSD